MLGVETARRFGLFTQAEHWQALTDDIVVEPQSKLICCRHCQLGGTSTAMYVMAACEEKDLPQSLWECGEPTGTVDQPQVGFSAIENVSLD